MNFEVTIKEKYPRIFWKLASDPFADYTLGTSALIKWNDSQCSVFQVKLFCAFIHIYDNSLRLTPAY
jgi:hypothetical protein